MILATRHGDRAFSSDPFLAAGSPVPIPSNQAAMWAGRPITARDIQGLPAALAAVRLLAETTGTLPLIVYEEDGDGNRIRARGTPQWTLLHDRPNPIHTPFDLIAYLVACLQWQGNAYLLKVFGPRRKVRELWPLDPRRVWPKIVGTGVVYDVRQDGLANSVPMTTADLVHVRGILTDSAFVGVSPVTAHAQALGITVAAEEYAGRYFANDASPSGLVSPDGSTTPEQRREFRESWEGRHRGAASAHRMGVMPFKGTYQQIGVGARDAQLLEARQYGVEEVARIFRVPPGMLGSATSTGTLPPPEQESMRFLTYSLAPWISRIEQALAADGDLFANGPLRPEFLVDSLLRADTPTRYASYLPLRQAGVLTANEIRRIESYPPHEDGDALQITPVGGAPNLKPAPSNGGPPSPDAVVPDPSNQ